MSDQIKQKLRLLEVFLATHSIQLEAMTDADGIPYIDLNILTPSHDTIEYDSIGSRVN